MLAEYLLLDIAEDDTLYKEAAPAISFWRWPAFAKKPKRGTGIQMPQPGHKQGQLLPGQGPW